MEASNEQLGQLHLIEQIGQLKRMYSELLESESAWIYSSNDFRDRLDEKTTECAKLKSDLKAFNELVSSYETTVSRIQKELDSQKEASESLYQKTYIQKDEILLLKREIKNASRRYTALKKKMELLSVTRKSFQQKEIIPIRDGNPHLYIQFSSDRVCLVNSENVTPEAIKNAIEYLQSL